MPAWSLAPPWSGCGECHRSRGRWCNSSSKAPAFAVPFAKVNCADSLAHLLESCASTRSQGSRSRRERLGDAGNPSALSRRHQRLEGQVSRGKSNLDSPIIGRAIVGNVIMAKVPTTDTIAAELTVPERVLLFCLLKSCPTAIG